MMMAVDVPVAVDTVVVSAARLPTSPADAAFSIVTLDPLALQTNSRVDDVIKTSPGASLFRRGSSAGANPTTQGVSLRSIAPSGAGRALVTLDGVPQNDPFGNWVIWTSLTPEALQGASVVRGAGAGAYGAGALTGVVALDEKPSSSESQIASMGILLFDTPALEAALARPVVDLAADVLSPLLEAGIPVHAHRFDGYWEDVGTLHSYYRANMDLLRPEPSLQLDDPAWPILSRDEERPPVRILPGARLEESLAANGCRVAGHIRRSILFPGVIVEEGAEVVDSVLMQDVHVEAGARIERAIVDKLARVGRGALVGGGGGEAVEPTLVGKYAVTPAGARVGAGAVLGIGAGADDFKGAEVPAGERVRDRLEKATP